MTPGKQAEFPRSLTLYSGAIFSADRVYRYRLWRTWGDPENRCIFVMCNPSIACATESDPTVTRCINFAKLWNYGGLDVVNIFAVVSTEPLGLLETRDPVGPENDAAIASACKNAKRIVLAWGSHRKSKALVSLVSLRAANVRFHLGGDYYAGRVGHLGTNGDGAPKHPLYLAASTPFQPL